LTKAQTFGNLQDFSGMRTISGEKEEISKNKSFGKHKGI
jgi:hypothetical protein